MERDWIFIMTMFCCLLSIAGASFVIGYVFEMSTGKTIGLYYHNISFNELEDSMLDRYSYDEWVCIDIGYLKYEDALSTCRHEVAHYIYRNETSDEDYARKDDELFARTCEAFWRERR